MAFGKRGFHTFSDTISRTMWGGDVRDVSTGDLSISLESQPVTSEPRDKCLRFHSASGAGSGRSLYPIHYMPHGLAYDDENLVKSHPTLWIRQRVLITTASAPSSGSISVMEFQHGDESVYRVVANSDGTLTLSTGATGVGTLTPRGTGSTAITFGQWFEIILAIDSAGATASVKLKREGDNDYSTEISASDIPNASEVAAFAIGPTINTLSGNGETSIYVDGFAVSDRSEADVLKRYVIAGSGCRDVSADTMALALVVPDGLFAGTYARVQYSREPGFLVPNATSFVAVSGAASSVLPILVSGLSAGTRYYYHFQVATADDAGAIVWTSETYQARTLRSTAKIAGKTNIVVSSCNHAYGAAHPYEIEENHISQVAADSGDLLMFMHVGDQGYEGANAASRGIEQDYGTAESYDDYEQMLREFVSDHAYHELMRAGMFLGQPDDHQFINDGDGRMKPGESLATVLANDWGGRQGTYQSGTTLGDLWTWGITSIDNWYSGHYLDKPTVGARYKSWVDGDTRIVLVDTRTERNPDTPIMVSTAQLSWIKDQIDEFVESSSKFLVFVCNGGWNERNTKTSEGWERVAPGQYYELMTYLNTHLPSTKKCCIARGDDHCGYLVQTVHETASGVSVTNASIGPEMVFSGVAASSFGSSGGSGVPHRYPIGDEGYPPANRMIRVSGGLLTIDHGAGVINAKAWAPEANNLDAEIVTLPDTILSGNASLGRGKHSVPPPLQGMWLHDVDTASIADLSGQGRTATFTGETLPTVVTGPSDWLAEAVSFDGSNDRIAFPGSAFVGAALPRTYMAWVSVPAFGEGSEVGILDLGRNTANGSSGRGLQLFAEDNAFSISAFGSRRISQKSALTTDTWYHVAIRVPEGATTTDQIELLIDGVQQALSTEAGSNQTLNTTVETVQYAGHLPHQGTYGASRIADFRSYNRALSDEEISQIIAGPEPINVTPPVLASDGTCTSGTWNSQSNGTITRLTTLYLTSDGSVVATSTATDPDFSADVTEGLIYHVVERASNDGGHDELEDTASASVMISGDGPEPDPPVLTTITVSPATVTIDDETTQQFTATGLDQYGDDFALTEIDWSVVTGSGSIDSEGLFTANGAGETIIRAAVGDVSDDATITVNAVVDPPALETITVSPATATVTAGSTQQFTATQLDQYGEPIETVPVIWSADTGTIDEAGLYTAPGAAGSDTVTATVGEVSGTASVTVTADEPELNTWPDTSKVATTETWYENGVLKTGTMTSGGASILYVIATN